MIFSARIKHKGQVVLESTVVYCKSAGKPGNGPVGWQGRFGVSPKEVKLFKVGDQCTILADDDRVPNLEIVISGFHPKSGAVLFESLGGFKKKR